MSITILRQVFESFPAVKGADRLVLLAVAFHLGEDDPERPAWPSVRRLAALTRLSERQVQVSLRNLEELGALRTERNAGPRGVNRYYYDPTEEAFYGYTEAPSGAATAPEEGREPIFEPLRVQNVHRGGAATAPGVNVLHRGGAATAPPFGCSYCTQTIEQSLNKENEQEGNKPPGAPAPEPSGLEEEPKENASLPGTTRDFPEPTRVEGAIAALLDIPVNGSGVSAGALTNLAAQFPGADWSAVARQLQTIVRGRRFTSEDAFIRAARLSATGNARYIGDAFFAEALGRE